VKKQKEIELLRAQIDMLSCTNRLAIYRGGIGAGKTLLAVLMALLNASKGRRVLFTEPTQGMITDIIEPTIYDVENIFGVGGGEFRKKPTSYTYRNGGVVNFRSAESPRSLRGGNYHDFYMDEPNYNKNDEAYRVGIGRIRRSEDATIRMFGSPNGRDWVYNLSKRDGAGVFTQTTIDNYFLPQSYIDDLLDQYTGEFLRQEVYGEIVDFNAGIYPTSNIEIIENPFINGVKARSWDLGFTENKTSDFSAGALCCYDGNSIYINDIVKVKFEFPLARELIINTAQRDGIDVKIIVETGGTQQAMYQDLIKEPRLKGYNIIPVKPTVGKVRRHFPLATAMQRGCVKMLRSPWNDNLKDEFSAFSFNDSHEHDDQIDAIAQAYNNFANIILNTATRTNKMMF
jgi:predicted phage terminase large subunit-like protein